MKKALKCSVNGWTSFDFVDGNAIHRINYSELFFDKGTFFELKATCDNEKEISLVVWEPVSGIYEFRVAHQFVLELLNFMNDDSKLLFDCSEEMDKIIAHAKDHNTREPDPISPTTPAQEWVCL